MSNYKITVGICYMNIIYNLVSQSANNDKYYFNLENINKISKLNCHTIQYFIRLLYYTGSRAEAEKMLVDVLKKIFNFVFV